MKRLKKINNSPQKAQEQQTSTPVVVESQVQNSFSQDKHALIDLSSYPEDQSYGKSQEHIVKEKKPAKKKKEGLQIKNKLFKDVCFQQITKQENTCSFGENSNPQLELVLPKKEKRDSTALETKLLANANRIRNKLDYKRPSQSKQDQQILYKSLFKQTIMKVSDVQNLQIQVQVPKVIGNGLTNAALYLKNVRDQSAVVLEATHSKEDLQKPNAIKMKNGKKYIPSHAQYFGNLKNQLKTQKIECINDNIIKQIFANSQLDENDVLEEKSNEASHLIRKSMIDLRRKSIDDVKRRSVDDLSRISKASSKCDSRISHVKPQNQLSISQDLNQNSILSQKSLKLQKNQTVKYEKIHQTIQEKLDVQESNSYQRLNEEERRKIAQKLGKIAKRIESRKQLRKQNKKKSKKQINIRQFFEQQAQESSEQGCPRNEAQQYEGVELDEDLVDMIDNTPELKGDDQAVYRKFVEDMRLQDDRLLQRIKAGMFGRTKKAEKSKRLIDLIKKQKEQKIKNQDSPTQQQPLDVEEKEKEEDSNKNNQQLRRYHLQRLQQQLKLEIKPAPQPAQSSTSFLTEIASYKLEPKAQIKRSQRTGLKDGGGITAFKVEEKGKKKKSASKKKPQIAWKEEN